MYFIGSVMLGCHGLLHAFLGGCAQWGSREGWSKSSNHVFMAWAIKDLSDWQLSIAAATGRNCSHKSTTLRNKFCREFCNFYQRHAHYHTCWKNRLVFRKKCPCKVSVVSTEFHLVVVVLRCRCSDSHAHAFWLLWKYLTTSKWEITEFGVISSPSKLGKWAEQP